MNYTRFDVPRAVPSSDELQIQFTALAVINAIVAVACLTIVLSILRNKTVRSNPFNLYLFCIATPDFIISFLCMLTCALSAPIKEYYSEWMCGFQSFYLVWGFTSNCWMNGVIVYQIHKLLRHSHIRRRYTPPSRKQVLIHACIVYLYACFWGLLGAFNITWLPHKTTAFYGFACFPVEYDLPSTIFWWLVFAPGFLLIPILYVVYVLYDIWKRDLLPKQGRRRNLSIYFFRLIFVYFFMWTPSLFFSLLGNFVKLSPWVYWIGATWSHLQGLASSIATLTKPDIKDAVLSFLACKSMQHPDSVEEHNHVTTHSSSRLSDTSRSASIRISLMQSFRSILPSSLVRSMPSIRRSERRMNRSSLDTTAAQKVPEIAVPIREETPSQANGSRSTALSSTTLGRTTLATSIGMDCTTTHYDDEEDDIASVNSQELGAEFSVEGRPSRRVTFIDNSGDDIGSVIKKLDLPSGCDSESDTKSSSKSPLHTRMEMDEESAEFQRITADTIENGNKNKKNAVRNKNKEYGLEDSFDQRAGGNVYDAIQLARVELCREIIDFDIRKSDVFKRRRSRNSQSASSSSPVSSNKKGMSFLAREAGFCDEEKQSHESASISTSSSRLNPATNPDTSVIGSTPASLADGNMTISQEFYANEDSDEISA